jgi:hypothetical protein
MLRAIVFVVAFAGLSPRLATEREDSSEERVAKIRELIRSSKYSIHDLSRMEALKENDLPRFNMPFELGLDVGCKYFGQAPLNQKCCLILEREQYRYQRVLSDISGNDIRAHGNSVERAVKHVRHWLRINCVPTIPSGNFVWQSFNEFYAAFEEACKQANYDESDINEMPVSEYLDFVVRWVAVQA